MHWLEHVAKYHNDFVRIVRSYGETEFAEDIVQEMYLRLDKYGDKNKIFMADGKINKAYIFFTLRNIFRNLCIQRSKHKKVDLNELKHIPVEFEYISKDEGRNKFEGKIKKEIETWHWYDQMLFKYYRENNWSMREASKNTGIGTASVFRTIKYCKDRLRKNCAEDYEDFINGDYEKL